MTVSLVISLLLIVCLALGIWHGVRDHLRSVVPRQHRQRRDKKAAEARGFSL